MRLDRPKMNVNVPPRQQKTRPMETSHSNLCRCALAVLFSLVALILYYRMQAYLMVPFSALSRLALYGALFVLVVVLLKGYQQLPIGMLALLGSVLLTAAQTALLAGTDIAFHATARFINVMMLVPFAALLFTGERHMERVFWLFWAVFLCALASLLIQFWGWPLDTLVNGYIAIRGDLIRHLTLVGEPNVGGMLAVIAYTSCIMLARRRSLAVLMGALAVAFVTLSISKAAMLGLGVALVACFCVVNVEDRKEAVLRATLAGLAGLLFIWLIGAGDYVRVSLESLVGAVRGEPSAYEAFQYRQSRFDTLAVFDGSLLPAPLNYVFGASFAEVGSAAQEVQGPGSEVFLPHNSYLELLLTGGVFMLSIVLLLMARTYSTLWRSRLPRENRVDRCVLVCFVVLTCWMLIYPVIYEPVTGCLFWIIVGYGNRVQNGSKPLKSAYQN